ncbi:MAG: hypothetical protein MI919_27195 [Holophagales bacterium]|nr:hypothetical protein [Holophagales bacterium]
MHPLRDTFDVRPQPRAPGRSRRPALGFPWLPLLLVAALATWACTGGEAEGPSWLRELPKRQAPADWRPGSQVWATVPGEPEGTAELGLFRVAALVEGERSPSGRIRVADPLGRSHLLPVALVHAVAVPGAASPGSAEPGSVVLAFHGTGGPVLARLRSADPLEVSFDWNGATVTDRALALAVPDPETGLPRPVLYHDGSRWLAGVAVAEDGDRLWVLDEARRVHVLRAGEAVPREPLAEPSPGDGVQVYSWAEGLRSGRVVEVLEPGLRYRVDLEGGADAGDAGSPASLTSRPVAFDSLFAAAVAAPAEGPATSGG